MKIIHSDKLPAPGGHYSPAVLSGNHLYISGQLPISLDNPQPRGDLAEQAHVVFSNIDALLATENIDKCHLINVQIYLCDVALWPELNRLYAEWEIIDLPVPWYLAQPYIMEHCSKSVPLQK